RGFTPFPSTTLFRSREVIARVDILTINDAEARQLSGEHSLVKAAAKILAMGPTYLVVKKGEHGALLFSSDRVFFSPALPLEEVVDRKSTRLNSSHVK